MIKSIANHFSLEDRKIKTIEECSELITAISRNDVDNIIEEIADVVIMIRQLVYLYGIEHNVEEIMEFKLKRTVERYGIECKQ